MTPQEIIEHCQHGKTQHTYCADCHVLRQQGEIERLKSELAEKDKYIGFLQSCTRSGESWDGTIDDFNAKKGDTKDA